MSGPYTRVGARTAEPEPNGAERQRQEQRRELYDRIGTKVSTQADVHALRANRSYATVGSFFIPLCLSCHICSSKQHCGSLQQS